MPLFLIRELYKKSNNWNGTYGNNHLDLQVQTPLFLLRIATHFLLPKLRSWKLHFAIPFLDSDEHSEAFVTSGNNVCFTV